MPKDFNTDRAARAHSDRDLLIGPFTFTRVVSARPEVLIGFNRPEGDGSSGVDQAVIDSFDDSILALLEPACVHNPTGNAYDTSEAWTQMRQVGDENGVISFADMGEIVKELLGGVVERPTPQPSVSSDGSQIPESGTNSTEHSLPPVAILRPSTPAVP